MSLLEGEGLNCSIWVAGNPTEFSGKFVGWPRAFSPPPFFKNLQKSSIDPENKGVIKFDPENKGVTNLILKIKWLAPFLQ